MDFTVDETQAEIGALTAKVLGDDPAASWRALADAGLLALALPTALDGDGLGVAEVTARCTVRAAT